MNDELQKFAREQIKNGLSKLPESNRIIFKKMYSYPGWTNNPVDNLSDQKMDINDVVDKMPADKLDWAMQQVSRSLKKMEVEI